ncbi:heme A synthase [Parashewanella curva]|uniref:Heme A synthase n=1 Tax=Parashewanella curva TaxID=2338552 RepID=A0A3L8PX97_9GAMM|nr:COX15/CtaA family protein [Parashewanella curva]RLV59253.1 heme A synthase [Parashewanella curva]
MKSRLLIGCAILLAFTVILMGAYTRLSNAGLSCPDWPKCYDHLTVPTQTQLLQNTHRLFLGDVLQPEKAWLEMIHRYLAGSLSLLILAILIQSLTKRITPRLLTWGLVAVVVFQALLGMWTVTMKLMPIVVMSHLLGGYCVISLLWLIHLNSIKRNEAMEHCSAVVIQRHAALGLFTLVIQIILGGWTSTNYAALACTSLPICQGNWINHLDFTQAFSPLQGLHKSYEFGVLSSDARMTIHICHRIWAMVTSCVLGSLAFRLLSQQVYTIKKSGYWLLGFLCLQISLGVMNVLFQLPIGIAVAHNAGALMLLLCMLYINFHVWRQGGQHEQ